MSHSISLIPRLEPLLARVSRPVQYVGSEVNSILKDWASVDVRWCLMYPDAYEVGQPNQGLAILYEVLNERDWILAERTYSIWGDLAGLMREAGVPQFSWESAHPVKDFDIVGVSLSTELGLTNLIEALDLAQIAIHAADRGEDDPLIIVGGHVSTNPEPVADFIDAAVMGDGEEAVLWISEIVRSAKRQGLTRVEVLERLAGTGLVYVPSFYDVTYREDHTIEAVRPNRPGVPAVVRKNVVTDLDSWPYPKHPLIPLAETVHERYSAEIFRGCMRGCRFCQAGMITRPVRERSIDVIGQMVDRGLAATGYEEVGLLSLSSADHSEIAPLTQGLSARYAGTNVSLSLPSTRVDAFNIDLARELSRNGRRSGLTFAPEGGSERMRRVINKNVDEDDLIATVEAAFSAGWRSVKLYFMAGLPTETDADVMAVGRVARRVIDVGRSVTGRRDVSCTISIGAFVPKAHTSFQWAAQCDAETVNRRMRALKDSIREDRQYSRAIFVKYADGRPGQVEGLLARGDRRVGRVIEQVWRSGGIFDGWSEHFSYDRWVEATDQVLTAQGLSMDWYTTRERESTEILPWDHLDVGLDRDWLWDDWQDSLSEISVPDCRWEGCTDCGVCPGLQVGIEMGPTGRVLDEMRGTDALSTVPAQSTASSGLGVVDATVDSRPVLQILTPGSTSPSADDNIRDREDESPGTDPAVAAQDLSVSDLFDLQPSPASPDPISRPRKAQPPQQAPPVTKLLVQYGKRESMRFASHRDFARCFERGLRRAGIPMAYSSGFHPHQRVSYVNPAPTGAASEAEFLVIAVREMVDAADAHARLDCVMPRGFPILKVSTMETERHFDASEWEVTLPGCEEDSLREAVGRFVQAPTAEVSRLTKKGVRTFDAKPPVLALEMAGTNILRMVIRHDEPLVRPDDIVTALRQMGTLPDIPALTTRLNQGALYDLVSVDPVLGK